MVLALFKHPEVIFDAPHLRFVDQDLLEAVGAIKIKGHTRRGASERLLDGCMTCGHCGKPLGVQWYTEGNCHVYVCNSKRRRGEGIRLNRISVEEAEAAVIPAVREVLDRPIYDGEFAAQYDAEIAAAEDELRQRLEDMKRTADRTRSTYDAALRAILGPMPPTVLDDLRGKIEEMREKAVEAQADVALAEAHLGALSHERRASRDRRDELSSFLNRIDINHPWKPASLEERRAFNAVRKMIKTIVVTDNGDAGRLDIELVMFRVAGKAEAGTGNANDELVDVTRRITVEDPGLLYKKSDGVRQMRAAKKAFEDFADKITDAEFKAFPSLGNMYGAGEQLRFFIDALMVAEATKISPATLLWAFDRVDEKQRFDNLRSMGGLPIIIQHLRKTRGDNFNLTVAPTRETASLRNTLINARDPLALLDVCDPSSGKTEMDARQRAVVLRVCDTSHHMMHGAEAVRVFNAYFATVRHELPMVRGYEFGADRNDFRILQNRPREMSDITRGLLELQGYVLPVRYKRPDKKAYSTRKVPDPQKVLAEMAAALPTCPVSGDFQNLVIESDGVSINLATGELLTVDGTEVKISLNGKLILLCLLRNVGRVVSIGTLEAAMVPWGNKPRHPRQTTNKMLTWLRKTCPTLGADIRNVYGKGYIYAPRGR